MTKRQKIPFRTQGTSVLTRVRSALDPEYFGIDEREMSDLMVFALEFSKNVQYVNNENVIDKNWLPFFEKNLAFVLAQISCTDIDHLNNRFKRSAQLFDSEISSAEKKACQKGLLQFTFELFETIDNWFKTSKHDIIHLEENKLYEQLQNAISHKLSIQRRLFENQISLFEEDISDNKTQFDFNNFDAIWLNDGRSSEDEATPRGKTFTKDIALIHKALLGVITYLKTIAPQLLEHSLKQYPHHSPHISLFLSFIKSFKYVQRDMNRIVQRHLDYYYERILKQSLRSAQPDHAHVYFEPAEHILQSTIPAGTLLVAGTDEEGMEYTYATDHSMELNQGAITDVKVIHVAQNQVIGLGGVYKSVSNIYAKTVKINDVGIALDKTNNPAPFDTFGKDQADINFELRDMQQGHIGFALASPILMLKEGERKINITYKLSLKSMSSLVLFIEEMSKEKDGKKDASQQDEGGSTNEQENPLTPEKAFYQIMNNIFKVRATTETGWFQTGSYEILPPKSWTSGEIRIDLLFDISDPALIGYNKEFHGEGYSTKWPVVEFILSSELAMYAYSYLRDLTIEQCKIDVLVNKVKDLHIYNDLGKLDTNKPFYPFGTTPDLGSYFLVGNEEIFVKNLKNISLDIHWHNLPRNNEGFQAHYANYKREIETNSFTAAITGLSEFQFHPSEEKNKQEISLFEESLDNGIIKERKHVGNIDLEKLRLKPNYMEMGLEDYNSQTRSGFLKFEITGPEIGFGHSEYPKLFAEAIVDNAKVSTGMLSSKEPKKVDLPNEPYAPQIREISLNYTASTVLTMNQDQLAENDKSSNDQIYHLHPFGKHTVFENGLPIDKHLVAQFNDEGYLLLGLENIHVPAELSIYFELEDNVNNEITHNNIPETKWRYLIGNQWMDFEENELIFDSTNSFTTSGIVRLRLPTTIDANHDILPTGKYWLSVSSENNTQILSKTILVKMNAVQATWKAHKPGEQWKNNIPKETISDLIETRTDVIGVYQPFPSFGGSERENATHYYMRVGERLKHKNRAITPEDYEKIILDNFPFLFQVKCLNKFSCPEIEDSGLVRIIVVPKINYSKGFYEPKVDYNQLNMIENHLRQMISPYANIEVINPIFEKVRINCRIRLQEGKKSGEFVKRLESDLRKFICPWFDSNQREMDFGGSIERDDILSFIESLEYVKFVTKLSVIVLHYRDGQYGLSDSATDEGKTNKLMSSSSWNVLVPARDHEIELIDKSVHEMPEETRIETMKIGTDFVIIDEEEDDVEFPFFDLDKDTYYAIEIDL